MESFPILKELNEINRTLYKLEHGEHVRGTEDFTTLDLVVFYIGHKALSVVTIPTNIAMTAVGLVGMIGCATVVGSFKVIIFAASLGHERPTFPTGTQWFAERAIKSFSQAAQTIGENIYDLTFYPIAKVIERTVIGLKTTYDQDKKLFGTPEFKSIIGVEDLHRANKKFIQGERTTPETLGHMAVSIINIPLNVAAAGLMSVVSVGLIAPLAFATGFKALTNYACPIPTGFFHSTAMALGSLGNAATNTYELYEDTAVIVYETAKALHIRDALVRVQEVLSYIPEAMFGS